ncbi:maltose O-acetyltransferase [Pyrenophora tritici-repentis]|nr:maltose O-acetyltransferase [Pyrenophora tritici-repentis]
MSQHHFIVTTATTYPSATISSLDPTISFSTLLKSALEQIGTHVTISTLKTPTDTKSQKDSNSTETARETIIGQNVYLGDGVIVEAGVKIGNNAIVRAGSVVVRGIASDAVVHETPAFR